MPVNKKNSSSTSASRLSRTKAAGTRVGVLSDWRQGSGKSGRTPHERRNVLRDGR